MQYKTIILELLQDRPALYKRLRSSNRLLPTLDATAAELKARHEHFKATIASRRPDSHPIQTASEAMELAIAELQGRLPSESPPPAADETFSLDAAMSHIRQHTPSA
jgi:hypothetical protein